MIRTVETLILCLVTLGVGLMLWANGMLVTEKEMWRREAMAAGAERISAERLLGRCEGRKR